MFKLLLPSAHEVAWMCAFDSREEITTMIAAERIMECSMTNLWFYILDYKLDGIDGPAGRFLHSIEQGINMNPHPEDDFSARARAYLINYVHIEKSVYRLSAWMIQLLSNIMTTHPDLTQYSNSCSYLEYMGADAVFIVFFNNVYERDVYVQQRSIAV